MVRFIEWFNAAVLLNFGITLLRPGCTFCTSHSYDALASIATEREWGLALIFVAGIRIVALTLNGTFGWFKVLSPWARIVTAFLSAFAWFFIAIGLFYGNSLAPGWGTYLIHMLSDIFIAGCQRAGRCASQYRIGNS